jgi:hypothetical protein
MVVVKKTQVAISPATNLKKFIYPKEIVSALANVNSEQLVVMSLVVYKSLA